MQGHIQYAGFWVRAAAILIDSLLLVLIISPLKLILYGEYYMDYYFAYAMWDPNASLVLDLADLLVSYALPAVAVILFWKSKGATPGKMAMSLEIVSSKTGGSLSSGQCIGRYFSYIISGIFFLLGFLWIAFDKRKQGWHDKLAGTVVIRRGPEAVHFPESTSS